MTKRLEQAKIAFVCPICGTVILVKPCHSHRQTCSRECSMILREQIEHPERYESADMTPYALARACVRWGRKQGRHRDLQPRHRQVIGSAAI